MKITKRALCFFLAAVLLLTSLPATVFAAEVPPDEASAQEKDSSSFSAAFDEAPFTSDNLVEINGVVYMLKSDKTVKVYGHGFTLPERVEILSHVGGYTVNEISWLDDREGTVKHFVIPETVKSVRDLNLPNLETLDIKGDYIEFAWSKDNYDTPFYKNEDNWKDDLLISGSCLIASRAEDCVTLGEEITSISRNAFWHLGTVEEVRIYNENCVMPSASLAFPNGCKLFGKENSTAQRYVEANTGFNYSFHKLCTCDDVKTVAETPTFCDGTLGYTEGVWCDRCNMWRSGHRKNQTVTHFDENKDGVCDNCKAQLDKNIIASGIVGDNAFWTIDSEGTLLICGRGNLYPNSHFYQFPWRGFAFKHLVIANGIEDLSGVSFRNRSSLESVEMADTVVTAPSSFKGCTALKKVTFSSSLKSIDSGYFYGCTSLESVVLPKSVKSIGNDAFRNCSNLRNIDFETGYVRLGSDVFTGTAAYNDPNNIRDGILYIDNCLIKEITPGTTSLVLGPEITSIAYDWCYRIDTKITSIEVRNPDCVFPKVSSTIPSTVVEFKVLPGSTAEAHAKVFFKKYTAYCLCDDAQTVAESYGYCDGTIGYTEGKWCERCQIWQSGHKKNSTFLHIDKNNDKICDFCSKSAEGMVIKAGKCGKNISWYLAGDDTLYLNGTGKMESYLSPAKQPWAKYDSIKKIEISDGITSIGDYAFWGCKNVTEINLSSVITQIGTCAFLGCESLAQIELPETVYSISNQAFRICKSLKNVVLPCAATDLGSGIFQDCTQLESVEIKGKISKIPENMFWGCKNLVTFKSGGNISVVDRQAFYNCVKLSSFDAAFVHIMHERAFAYCESIESIDISRLTEIPSNAFTGCKKLSDVKLNKSLKSVGFCAFFGCDSLETVVLPKTVTLVDKGAFGKCKSLKEITFLNDNIKISRATVASGGVDYNAISPTAVIKANRGSKAESYADVFNMSSVPLSETDIVSVELTKKPNRLIYLAGKDTEFSADGAVVTVRYANGNSVDYKNAFSVDWKDADITKEGEYTAAIIFGGRELPFKISVVNAYVLQADEGGVVSCDVYCPKGEEVSVCFVPSETKQYKFAIDGGKNLAIRADAGAMYELKTWFTKEYTYEKGKTYYIYIKSESESQSIRIIETGDVFFTLRSDGTYEAKGALATGNVVIPAMYGNIPVTKVADGFTMAYSFQRVNSVTVSEGIKEIGNKSFKNFNGEVLLPESIEYIGNGAFYGSNISSVTLSEKVKAVGDEAFYGCDGLETLKICSGKTAFGKNVFSNCINLKKVSLCEDFEKFSEGMFSGCKGLEEVVDASGIKTIADNAFNNCTSLRKADFISQAEDIGSCAFLGCKQLSEITLSEKLTSISKRCFYGCESLKSVRIPDSVTTVGNLAFYGCKSLSEIEFGKNLKEVMDSAFANTAITVVEMPDTVEKWGSCFHYCEKLKEVVLPKGMKSIPRAMFYGCSSLEKVISKNDITEVGGSAFSGCQKLTSIDFWGTVEKVGMYAFARCPSLESAPFEKVKIIEQFAFSNCEGLKSVSLPLENTFIGERAFFLCTALKEIEVKANSTVEEEAFNYCSSLEKAFLGSNTAIGNWLFYGCGSLKEIYLLTCEKSSYILGNLPSDVVIYGYEGSRTKQFAKENGYKFEVVSGHMHTYTVEKVNPKRCFDYTTFVYTCNCGYSYSEKQREGGGTHCFGEFTVDKEPTCTEYGVKSKHCYCGKERINVTEIKPLGHTEVVDIPAVAPTKTAPGYTQQSHCSVCGKTLSKRTLIGHGDYEIRVENDTVIARKLSAATAGKNGSEVTITFTTRNNVCESHVDKTVIYKVGEVKLSKTKFLYNGKIQKPSLSVEDSRGKKISSEYYSVKWSKTSSKNVGTYTVKVSFCGNYSGTKTLTYTILPQQVTGLRALAVKTASITLSWKKTDGAKYYRIEQSVDGKRWKTVTRTEKTTYTVSKLKAGTKYQFRVTALDKTKKLEGKMSEVLKTQTLTLAPKIKLASTKSKTAKLEITKVTGAKSYIIYKSTDGKKWKKAAATAKTSYSFTKLSGGKKIYVKVKAVNAYGKASAYGPTKSVTVKK